MNIKVIVLLTAIASSLGAIAYLSSKESSYTLVDVQDVQAGNSIREGTKLRVRGFIKPGSITREGRKAKFVLEQDKKILEVLYDGSEILPDTFKEGAKARADGILKNGKLISNHIETKCASKYESGQEGSSAP